MIFSTARFLAKVADGLEFDPSRLPPVRPADTHNVVASPLQLGLMALAGVLVLIALATFDRWRAPAKHGLLALGPLLRRFALALACIGLVIVLADRTLLIGLRRSSAVYELHRDGWLSFFGGTLTILGAYIRLRRAADS